MILDGHNTSPDNPLDVSAGGFLVGPGDGMSDGICVVSAPGVFILNAEAVRLVGADRLAHIVALAHSSRRRGCLSAGEFVVPQQAVAMMGQQFFEILNDAGNVLRDGTSPDPDHHQQLLLDFFETTIACLDSLSDENGTSIHPPRRTHHE